MKKLHIITPVKDSLDTCLKTIDCILNADIPVAFTYTIYNDFSSHETTQRLIAESIEKNFKLVNLEDVTTNPSPNYLLVLQMAQQKAKEENADLLIIESDVLIAKNTINQLVQTASVHGKCGLIAAVTTDQAGNINFPYLYAKKYKRGIIETKKRLSFCCTLLTNSLLKAYDFKELDPTRSWYDIFISRKSVELGFKNLLLTSLPVLHLPHSSRPWKLLKYTNPLKYYWQKLLNNKDKI